MDIASYLLGKSQSGGGDTSNKQDKMQFATMPSASASNLGKIYQYIGTTNANYTNGYFYKCVSDGETTPTYSWENIDVQEVNSVGSSFIYVDSSNYNDSNVIQAIDNAYQNYILNKSHVPIYIRNISSVLGANTVQVEFIITGGTTCGYQGIIASDYDKIRWISKIDGFTLTNGHITGFNVNPTSLSEINGVDFLGDIIYQNAKVLTTTNTTAFTPTANYHPATKKYVDDAVSGASGMKKYAIEVVNGTVPTTSANTELLTAIGEKITNDEPMDLEIILDDMHIKLTSYFIQTQGTPYIEYYFAHIPSDTSQGTYSEIGFIKHCTVTVYYTNSNFEAVDYYEYAYNEPMVVGQEFLPLGEGDGYDDSKIQVLKNVQGTLTWVDEI